MSNNTRNTHNNGFSESTHPDETTVHRYLHHNLESTMEGMDTNLTDNHPSSVEQARMPASTNGEGNHRSPNLSERLKELVESRNAVLIRMMEEDPAADVPSVLAQYLKKRQRIIDEEAQKTNESESSE